MNFHSEGYAFDLLLSCHTQDTVKPSCGSSFKLNGKVNDSVDKNELVYIAAAPAHRTASFSGSGLPFYSPQQAFDSTPNQGTTHVNDDGSFEIEINHPNSYYINLGSVLVLPKVYFSYYSNGLRKQFDIVLGDSIPYRMLSYPSTQTNPRKDAMFYNNMWSLPVRTQEEILYASAYPSENKMYPNFWGGKPAV